MRVWAFRSPPNLPMTSLQSRSSHQRAVPLLLATVLWLACACSGGGGGGGGVSGPQVSTLSILQFTGVTLSPAFSPAVLNYTGQAESTVDIATFSATSAGAQASVTFDGELLGSGSVAKVVGLDYGNNTFEIEVSSGDGTTTSTYTITIARATGARLSQVALSAGTLSPAFDPDTTEYDVAVGGLIPAITITPMTTSTGSLITVAGATVAAGQPSTPLGLAPGQTDIVIRIITPASEQRDYTFSVTREFVQEAKFDDNTTADFGSVLAIDGDTAVVGKPRLVGQAYVYVRNGASWSLQQTLSPSIGGLAGSNFGCDVAIDDDTIVVGASSLVLGGSGQAGAVFVFRRIGTTWVEQVALQPTTTNYVATFGISVAVDNGTQVAGCGTDEAFVFTDDGTTWVQRAIVTGANTQPSDDFAGTAGSIALHAGTLVIGARGEDSASVGVNSIPDENAIDSGAVYVFAGSGTSWPQQAYLKASNSGASDRFGANVDLDGETLVIGADQEDSDSNGVNSAWDENAPDSGAAYVFVRSGGGWTQQAYLKSFNSYFYHEFGSGVAVSGDSIVVGARGERSSGTGINPIPDQLGLTAGAVYVFERTNTVWSQTAFVKADVQNQNSFAFGRAVALDGASFVVGGLENCSAYFFR